MSEAFVTVARYTLEIDAQAAVARLEEAGIPAFLSGDLTANTLGLSGLGGQIQLQVADSEAARAVEVLAELARETKLDSGWEDEAADLEGWVCSVCDTFVDNEDGFCPGCQTRREGIRTSTPSIRATAPPGTASVRSLGEVTTAGLPQVPSEMLEEEIEIPRVTTVLGDDLARRAFRTALISLTGLALSLVLSVAWGYLLFLPLLVYSLVLGVRLVLFPGEMSKRGWFYFYAALSLDFLAVLFIGLFFLFLASLNRYLP
jgi:Putative prokaryotic signal transducing protein